MKYRQQFTPRFIFPVCIRTGQTDRRP